MNNTKNLISLLIIIALLAAGCSGVLGSYGSTKYLKNTDDQTTIQDLIDTWEDYDIHYSGLGVRFPLGLMFDPKNSDTTLEGKYWKKVEDQETLIEIVRWILPNTEHDPELSKMLGPNGRFYGYVYHSHGFVILKQTGDRKMYVYDLQAPIEEGDGEPQS